MITRVKTVATMLMTIAALAGCQDPVEPPSGPEQLYRDSCLLCHAGNGPGASAPDLTTLSAANGGQFPMDQVISIIDGREGVRAHGSPMPVWGAHHSAEEIREIAAYLASSQQ